MPSTEVDLAQQYQPAIREGMLKVTVLPFQQQNGATDCGLFSIAAAYYFARGDNVARLSFCVVNSYYNIAICTSYLVVL